MSSSASSSCFSSEDEFECYRIPSQFVQWYDLEPTFGWISQPFPQIHPQSAPKKAQEESEMREEKKKPRSTSAYALFFREKQATEKRAAPYATFGQISQRIARQWDGLSDEEKKAYKRRCDRNRKKNIANAVEERARMLLLMTSSHASRK